MEISNLQKECHECTKSKGFDLTEHVKQLLLIASEVNEALECIFIADNCLPYWLEDIYLTFKNNMDNLEHIRQNVQFKNSCEFAEATSIVNKENLGEELSDIIYRVLSYAGEHDIDIQDHLIKKHNKNKLRPSLHGKSF